MQATGHKYIIIGGSTKCGTTSVFAYLNDHPAVCGSRVKESRFFWNDAYALPATGVSHKDGFAQFDELFGCNHAHSHRVEATPDYLYDAGCAELIHKYIPDALMVFVLRHPISRVESWYKFAKQLNLIDAHASIEDYIARQWGHTDASAPQHMRALEQGRYAHYVQNYIDVFGKQQVLVLPYDELAENPKGLMQKICSRAGLDASFYSTYDFKVLNKSINVKDPEKFNKYRNFRRGLRKALKAMPDFIGKPFKAMIKPLDTAYISMTTRDYEQIQMDKELFVKLAEYYAADEAALEKLMQQH